MTGHVPGVGLNRCFSCSCRKTETVNFNLYGKTAKNLGRKSRPGGRAGYDLRSCSDRKRLNAAIRRLSGSPNPSRQIPGAGSLRPRPERSPPEAGRVRKPARGGTANGKGGTPDRKSGARAQGEKRGAPGNTGRERTRRPAGPRTSERPVSRRQPRLSGDCAYRYRRPGVPPLRQPDNRDSGLGPGRVSSARDTFPEGGS